MHVEYLPKAGVQENLQALKTDLETLNKMLAVLKLTAVAADVAFWESTPDATVDPILTHSARQMDGPLGRLSGLDVRRLRDRHVSRWSGPSALDELARGANSSTTPRSRPNGSASSCRCFLVGAATGGVVFGWLGDRIGRVRAMSLSILTYAIFTGLVRVRGTKPGTSPCLRFIASLGMGGEWALGVALVTEIWPDKSRALLAGLIGAASNVGMLLGRAAEPRAGELHPRLRRFPQRTGHCRRAP